MGLMANEWIRMARGGGYDTTNEANGIFSDNVDGDGSIKFGDEKDIFMTEVRTNFCCWWISCSSKCVMKLREGGEQRWRQWQWNVFRWEVDR